VPLPSQWDRSQRAVEHRLGCASRPDSERPLEATVTTEPGEPPSVRISRLGFGAGVGWYAQQSMDLTLDEAQQLVRLLSAAPQPPAPVETDERVLISPDVFRARKGPSAS
jgi:hypothetical protein